MDSVLVRPESHSRGKGLLDARARPTELPRKARPIPYFPLKEPPKRNRSPGPTARGGIWNWYWLGLVLHLLMVYLAVNFIIPTVVSGGLNVYLAQPLLWGSLAATAFVGYRHGLRHRPKLNRFVVLMALLTGLFQVATSLIAGLLFGFGHSPYSHQVLAVLGNLLYITSLLLALELTRAYLVAIFSQGNQILAVISPALLIGFTAIPFAKFNSVAEPQAFFRLQGEVILPAFSESLLAAFLAYLGGPVASIAYRSIIHLFEWLSPALPDLQWTIVAFLGTMVPAFGLIVIRNQVMPAVRREASQARGGEISTAWVMVAVTAAAMIWFNTGMFGYQPTLVSGVSMNPALVVGDVVVTKDVEAEGIAVGDIIRFRQGGDYIIHRVVEIERNETGTYFVTKGDGNNVKDPPFPAAALDGKVVATIPKIGWVSIGIRNLIGLLR